MPGITGKGLAIAFSGGILLWSGVQGKQVSGALKDIIAGKNPGGAGNTSITDPAGVTVTLQAATTGPGIGTPAAANEAILKTVAAGYGWGTGAEWNALVSIMNQESSFNNVAQNPTSTAYGMFQFLDTTWAGVGGVKTSNAMLQCVYGCKYIKQRYGDPIAAEAFHLANGYY
jgi:soluble lytic murein transglycosylase-like protein